MYEAYGIADFHEEYSELVFDHNDFYNALRNSSQLFRGLVVSVAHLNLQLKRMTHVNLFERKPCTDNHAYKCFYELLPMDYPNRLEFCQWLQNNLNNKDNFNTVFFSDEDWFYLSGYVNS